MDLLVSGSLPLGPGPPPSPPHPPLLPPLTPLLTMLLSLTTHLESVTSVCAEHGTDAFIQRACLWVLASLCVMTPPNAPLISPSHTTVTNATVLHSIP